MDIFHESMEIVKIIITVVGGVVIAWYWNQRGHTLEQYRYLDKTYHDLLTMYRENPQFGDSQKTTNYTASWQGEEALKYRYFAMTVHTVMEGIYDMYLKNIPDVWLNIFLYHTRLHVAWLRDNKEANRNGYVDFVLECAAA